MIDRYVRPFPRIRDSCGASHARIPASNESFAAGQAPRAAVAGFAVVWLRVHLVRQSWPCLGLFLERGPGILGARIVDRGTSGNGTIVGWIVLLRQAGNRGGCGHAHAD